MNNAFQGIGLVVGEVNLRETTNGTAVCQTTIMFATPLKDGKTEEAYIKCVLWDKGAYSFSSNVEKGMMVNLTGRLQSRTFTNKKGNRVNDIWLRIEHFSPLSANKPKPTEKACIHND